MQMGSKAD